MLAIGTVCNLEVQQGKRIPETMPERSGIGRSLANFGCMMAVVIEFVVNPQKTERFDPKLKISSHASVDVDGSQYPIVASGSAAIPKRAARTGAGQQSLHVDALKSTT